MTSITPAQIYQMITGIGDSFGSSFKEARQRGLDDEAEGAASRVFESQSGVAKGASQSINFGDALGAPEPAKFNQAGKMPTFAAAEGTAPSGADAAGLLRKFEGYRDEPYWDVNAYRVGYGSDTITDPQTGQVRKVQPGDRIERSHAEADLARRIPEFQATVARQVPAFAQLPDNVKSGLTSVAYNYGSLPKSVVAAVNSGDVNAIASAVEALPANPDRRRQEAAVIRGGSAADAPAPGAENAQGFVIPGQSGAGRVSTGMTPELYRDLRIMMRSDKFRPMATQLLSQMTKQRDIKTIDLGNAIGVMDDQGNIVRQIPKQQNPMTVSPGSTVYDPNTRQALFTADKPAEAPTTRQIKQADGSEVVVQWNQQTRAWEPMPAPEGGAAVKGPPKLTEVQSKDVGFYNRGSKIIDRLDQQDQSLTDTWSKLGGNLSNYLKSDAYRQAEQTGREFLAVILRKDTGAAVTPQEMEQYSSIYLPQPADDPDTIQQKKAARRTALEGIRMGLGTAEVLFNSQEALRGAAPQPQQTAPNAMAPSRADLEAEARRRGLLK